MKILTLNTWQERGPWEERWKVIRDGVAGLDPDVIGFQEVFNFDWIETMRQQMHYASIAVEKSGETGLALLSKWPLTDWECITYNTKSPTEPYSRYALFAEFDTGSNRVFAFNTHLSWRLPESEIRQKQVAELLEFMKKKSSGGDCFVMGDFNATPDTPEIHKILNDGGFTDPYLKFHPGETGLTWAHKNPYTLEAAKLDDCYPLPERRLDYIFFKKDRPLSAGLKSAEVVFTQPGPEGIHASDHYGVLVETRP